MTMQTLIHLSEEERAAHRARLAHKKRYVARDYETILSAYRSTHEFITLGDYVTDPALNGRRMFLLRHDIDHDYETALLMAAWEHARGIRATYCVLHTAWYYGRFANGRYEHTDELVRLCRELHEMGHEINLHNNAVVLALQTGADPLTVLRDEVRFLRSVGVPVTGSTTHGDAICRQKNFGNFEVFREAVKAERGGPRTVRGEAGEVRLGSISYADVGLTYESYDIARDIYITDSGGRLRSHRDAPGRRTFSRTEPASGEVVGFLAHPVWWSFSAGNT